MFLKKLDQLIEDRKNNPKEGSYTSSLFEEGLDRILRKIGEEAGEVIIAAKNNDSEELKNEAADLIFHLMVILRNQGLSLSDIDELLLNRNK